MFWSHTVMSLQFTHVSPFACRCKLPTCEQIVLPLAFSA